MKEKTKAYMAGLMDAEGSFTITTCKHNTLGHQLFDPIIQIHITSLPILKWAVKHFGGIIYKRKKLENKLQDWDWVTTSYQHSNKFISLIMPYLFIKKREAEVMQEFYGLYRQQVPQKREELRLKLKNLKNREALTTDTQDFSWKKNLVNAYLAAFFDGEGTVGESNKGVSRRLSLGNTAVPVLRVYKKEFGGNIYPLTGRPEHHTPIEQWQLDAKDDIEKTLLAIIPYLIIKRKESIAALQFLREKKIQSELARNRKSAPVRTQAA